jgi:hypothetical protein
MHFLQKVGRAGVLLAILAAGPLHAAEDEETSTAIVPVVGAVTGRGGVQWRADVELRNTTGDELVVAVTLPTIPASGPLVFIIASGDNVVLNDIMHDAFGLDGTLAPLQITTGGRRSVSVSCVIHGIGPKGEVQPQVVSAMYSDSFAPRSIFPGIAHDKRYRTNVGLVNLGETPSRLTLALQRLNGRNIATTTVVLPPLSLRHVPLPTLFPILTMASNLILVVESSSPSSYAYAAVLRNDTHDGVYEGP